MRLWLVGLLSLVSCVRVSSTSTTPPPARPAPTPQPQPQPQVRSVADPVTQIASRFHHTCALRKSGTVLCWGKNVYGQLGANGRNDSPRAVKAPVVGVVQVEVGKDFSCARRTAGDVLCWGNNEDGQLGDGRGVKPGALSQTPVKVAGLGRVEQISTGEFHACALQAGGAVSCWGNAGNGQLGNDSQRGFAKPIAIAQLEPVSMIASGANHVCALETRGTVQCWGRNTEGQLGDGKSGSRIKPVQVAGLEDAMDLMSGHNHTCAIRKSGAVACWGDNAFGQLGPGAGNERKRNTPVGVPNLTGVAQIDGGEGHTCARLTTGRATCWGANDQGQAGQALNMSRVTKPAPVHGVGDAADLGLGASHSCVARLTGEVACWGATEYGALGPYRLI